MAMKPREATLPHYVVAVNVMIELARVFEKAPEECLSGTEVAEILLKTAFAIREKYEGEG